jgi:ABC-type branched-subunit amino acid transport system ATPase component
MREAIRVARIFLIDEKTVALAENLRDSATTAVELKKALSVILASQYGASAKKIADTLKISERTVFLYRDELKKMAGDPRSKRNARRKTTWADGEIISGPKRKRNGF